MLVRFEDLDLFHVAPVVFLVFDLDCVSCGCIQVNFYTQVLCHSYPTDCMSILIDSLQFTYVPLIVDPRLIGTVHQENMSVTGQTDPPVNVYYVGAS